jgi:penicillin-binding protein 1A
VTLTQALSMSLNTVAVRLGIEVGPASVVRTAHRLGIASKLEANASIALGTSEVSMTELVGAYAPFANGGLAVSPHVVNRIRTVEGKKTLYTRPAETASQVIDGRAVAMMNTMMQQTIFSGSAKKAELPGWQAAGKTGTSQDFRDAWFIGYTSQLVTGVWLGNDDNSPTKKATGGGLPVEIWSRFMKTAHQGLQPQPVPGLAPSNSFSTNPIGQALSSLLPGSSPHRRHQRHRNAAMCQAPPSITAIARSRRRRPRPTTPPRASSHNRTCGRKPRAGSMAG